MRGTRPRRRRSRGRNRRRCAGIAPQCRRREGSRVFAPSTYTGATGDSPVPGSEIPILASFDSPGPLTTQPITATCTDSTPGYRAAPDSGIRASQIRLNLLRQFLEYGACRAPATGARRDHRRERAQSHRLQDLLRDQDRLRATPAGSGVSDTPIVSPIPCCSRTAIAARGRDDPLAARARFSGDRDAADSRSDGRARRRRR